ncbi:hypothetical protein SZ64_14185 [Erythrobacter sp. SG61-1L]|uniref:hypothetical protein n=1 Tax=Erythrobacter sp. SG61-1L TaxID=1603897 RepID=UPI0006C90134|nr:hypothetical protein [Erythrobacter sp. SG61-1L]KPL69153.1 hypothetical protein SZ64_14185 [Erythrobacter sp. SG61-1L]
MAHVFRAALRCALGSGLLLAPALAHAEEAQAGAASCPAERAVYTLPSEEGDIHASFIPARHWPSAASDLYFKLTTPRRDYWFSFAVSNGYSGITLLPVGNPYDPAAEDGGPASLLPETESPEDQDAELELLAKLRFLPLDANLMVAENPPSAGQEAPPYLMTPELGEALWYDVAMLTPDPEAEADSMPRGAFRITGCLAEAPAKAWP